MMILSTMTPAIDSAPIDRFVRGIIDRVSSRPLRVPHVSFALQDDVYDVQAIGDGYGGATPFAARHTIDCGDWRYATMYSTMMVAFMLRIIRIRSTKEYGRIVDIVAAAVVQCLGDCIPRWRGEHRPQWETECGDLFCHASAKALLMKVIMIDDVDEVFGRVAAMWRSGRGEESSWAARRETAEDNGAV
jgi:hypothetical protein